MRTADRFSIALFTAISMHVFMVVFINFDFSIAPPPAKSLEITIVQHKSEAPKEADFIAQANQQASGTEIRKEKLTSTEDAQFIADEIREITPPVKPQLASNTSTRDKKIISSQQDSIFKVLDEPDNNSQTLEEKFIGQTQLPSRLSSDIASLEALLDKQRQEFAKRPRIRRLTSVSAKSSVDAQYLDDWRRRIERIGNIHYPIEAKRNKLYGKLRLAVSISSNGYVKEIEILQSSGVRILDDAAIRIVRLAEPFQAFPMELSKEIDQLEIIRTWQFLSGNQLQSK
ncbi:TonB family protein [Marinomonas sp. 15G1-11]|uniref:TonB family protein n=1 Tax=Marinomonas phaeophyticola TaxID=3004091 RepID=A0ABT4JUH3_9GAMM|nr:energy transducer TonB [Marinomonas sp. 15G1-11]MCZ2722050.1 TonB family protein [Marinomonas sp. 15G1-11]